MYGDDPEMISLLSRHRNSSLAFKEEKKEEFKTDKF